MKKIRVLVVDDSAFSRRTITKMLEGMEQVEVVDSAINGEEGIHKIISLKPDLITLDLEMPKMDGFTLLRILTARFTVPVLVISALSEADKVFKALELGALDFIAKPTSSASPELLTIREDLQAKVLQVVQLAQALNRRAQGPKPAQLPVSRRARKPVSSISTPVDLVAIGASTGGPPALQSILSAFETPLPFAMVVSQHMPSGFTRAFAERLNRSSGFLVKEAQDGDAVVPGQVLIAPGGKNLTFKAEGDQIIVRVVAPQQSDRYIPCVDTMLQSAAQIYGSRMLAIILTGMGNDGSKGVQAVSKQGGQVIAESEESAVVFGMPREAIATGVVERILPLQHMAREIRSRCMVQKGRATE